MAYTTIDDPSGIFTANLYSGNATNGTTISTGHTNDLIWTKGRAGTYGGRGLRIIDSVRGATKVLYGDQDLAEGTNNSSSGVTGFASTSYTIGGDADFNGSGTTYVSWTWKIQAGVCDIQTYTGNGSARTISHNLGAVPTMMIIKKRNTAAPWSVGHASLAANQVLELNETDTVATDDTYWNNTRPTSSVFTVGTDGNQNTNTHTYLIYLFGNKQGVSRMGKYIGNGNADGTFVYTGFKPAFVMQKSTTTTYGWQIYDNKRGGFNPENDELVANLDSAETDGSGNGFPDFYSNGFKLRNTDINKNASGVTYIYMAFAENPFVTSTGVPATAR
jgi:hypothetical protein